MSTTHPIWSLALILTSVAVASGVHASWHEYPLSAGEVLSAVTHPTDPLTAWVGTRDAGVFKTTDGGLSFSPSRSGLTFCPIRSLALRPDNPQVLFAGTDFDGVWRSTDGGATWARSGVGVYPSFVYFNVVLDPLAPAVVYAGGFGGTAQVIGAVFKSTDGGDSWARADAGITTSGSTWVNGVTALAVDPDHSQVLYAGTTYAGIFRTTNGGSTWAELNDGVPWLSPPDYRQGIRSLAVDPHGSSRPSAMIACDYYVLGAGDVWELVADGEPLCTDRLYFHPTQTDSLVGAAGLSGVSRTTDAGATWSHSGPLTEDVALSPVSPSRVYAARRPGFSEPGGVYLSLDGAATWGWAGEGVHAVPVRSVTADPTAPASLFAGTGDGFLYRSTNGGGAWSRATHASDPQRYKFGFEVDAVAVHPTVPSRVFLATEELYRSTDGGATFAVVSGVESPTSIAASPGGEWVWVGSGGSGVYRSSDAGATWAVSAAGLPLAPWGDPVAIVDLAPDPGQASTVWAGTDRNGGVVRSTDAGQSWQQVGLTTSTTVTAVAVHPVNGDWLLAGAAQSVSESGIFRSTNGGVSWQLVAGSLPGVFDLLVDPELPDDVYAATEGAGVLRSSDGGLTWSPWGDGIFYPWVYSLALAERRLLASSYGSGLYWTSLPVPGLLFADDFESGGTSAWTSSVP